MKQYNCTPDVFNRREFFRKSSIGLGAAALSSLINPKHSLASEKKTLSAFRNIAPKAKRIIYLFQSGGPSQLDLIDYKPNLEKHYDKDLPDSVRQGQRITGMVAGQDRLPIAPSIYKFARHGKCGRYVSELLPYTSKIVDDICVIHSMHTEAINHDPAITLFQTGHQLPGRPSMGAWVDYGLGSANKNLPNFVVLASVPSKGPKGQGLLSRLWSNGFLPGKHQGVKFRSSGTPVAYLKDPPGIDKIGRRSLINGMRDLNNIHKESVGDPEIDTRIEQYEMAFRMQTSVPDLVDLSDEPEEVFDLYGEEAKKPGTFAANCLLARRMAERDVRFIQLYHRGWDHHGKLPEKIQIQCADVDRGSAALIQDLKRRGLLDDTLVIWGGEFGRTVYSQGNLTDDNYGRDHHGKCFSIWMAGGGIKSGISYGKSDDFSFNVAEKPIHVHDLQATILHLMGIDHERLTYRFQGREFRLTDVHGKVIEDILV